MMGRWAKQLLAKARERSLEKVAAAYAVAGWLMVQGAAIALPTYQAPTWLLRWLIAAVMVGFPIALAAGWIWNRERTAEVSRLGKLDIGLLSAIGIIGALTLGELAWRWSSEPTEERTVFAPAEASIAVLPFENLSSDRDAAYFAAGIQDEILTRLTKIGALKVISRTSTAHYASRPDNLPQIAQELGVANILEGSVQKIGKAAHINVQLIRAATDTHLWAEDYDRNLDDTFAVETEVAATIADTLNVKVTGDERKELSVKPTNNPDAYDAYLRGLVLFRGSSSFPDTNTAEKFLAQAVQLDPKFAIAWAQLSQVRAYQFFNGEANDTKRAAAQSALETALHLRPDLPETQLAQSYVLYHVDGDYRGAADRLELLHTKWPNNADVLAALGYIYRRLGEWDRARTYLEKAIAADPRVPATRQTEAELLAVIRDFPAAIRVLDAGLDQWPTEQDLIADKAAAFQSMGQLDRAQEVLAAVPAQTATLSLAAALESQAQLSRRGYAQTITTIKGVLGRESDQLEQAWLEGTIGEVQRWSGDSTAARANLIRARDRLLIHLRGSTGATASWFARGLASIYCDLGDRDTAMKYADLAVEQEPISRDALNGTYDELVRATVQARFGDRDHAIPALARLLKIPSPLTSSLLRLDPDFDNLRGDPRFQALLK